MTCRISSAPWGELDGQPVRLWSLSRHTTVGPMEICVAEYGAILQAAIVPDRLGRPVDVALGHDSLQAYEASDAYFGAVLGRCAGRVRHGRFAVDGMQYLLPLNEGAHHLHGGPMGFDRQVWKGASTQDAIVLRRRSPAGEMGYPGQLDVEVRYSVSPTGQLRILMLARADSPTVCNLSHHAYWNLAGTGTVLSHSLRSPAAFLLTTDADLLADGQIMSVAGTGCDFRAGKTIGRDFDSVSLRPNRDRTAGVGYDHTLVLGPAGADGLRKAATLFSPESGIGFDLDTFAPSMQVYSGGDLGSHLIGKGGVPCVQGGGIALEPQGFSCALEFAHFPSVFVAPDKDYRHEMVFAFFRDVGGET